MDSDEIPSDMWIHYCARRLKMHWRTVDPEQLEELAADLAGDPNLRALSPIVAAALFLEPVAHPDRARGQADALGPHEAMADVVNSGS